MVSHQVLGKVVTINNSGANSPSCCSNGICVCSSLYEALSSIENNTVVNITLPAVPLNRSVSIIGSLSNITITSVSNATIMCNNIGAVYFYRCSDVTIEGIIWDQCGNPKHPVMAGIGFELVSNISIINCTFQKFKICNSINISRPTGIVNIVNSIFKFNMISDVSLCKRATYSSLLIQGAFSFGNRLSVMIHDSLFFHNGNSSQSSSNIKSGSLLYYGQNRLNSLRPEKLSFAYLDLSILVKNTHFISNIIGAYIYDTAVRSKISFEHVNISDNSKGVLIQVGNGTEIFLNIVSSLFSYNRNGALNLDLIKDKINNLQLYNTTFTKNNGTSDTHGTALFASYSININEENICNISFCNFFCNSGGQSIVYISVAVLRINFPISSASVFVASTNFSSNIIGSGLYISDCFLKFQSTTLFQGNSAKSGAAIYVARTSQITVNDGSSVQFINNTASLHGGAIYMDLTNCYDGGVVFTNFTKYDVVSFINNSAELSGNSLYFNIPDSCDVITDHSRNDSAFYIPYKFNYMQSRNIIGSAVGASPYEINMCSSAKCNLMNSTNSSSMCVISYNKMLGQLVYFNAMICNYYYTAGEATYFEANCINCGTTFRLLDNRMLIQNGIRNKISFSSLNADRDLENDTNITVKFSSYSPNYRELTATLTLTLSSCYNGFLFTKQSQQCECYNKDDYLQCDGDVARIKLGYWFGVFSGKYVLSSCNNNYCNFFTHRKEAKNGFYNLPEKIDYQCNSHRTGVACGKCSEGYTLAYNSPDCISVDKCSPGMIVLVVVLTAVYWIAIAAMLFGVAYYFKMQAKISLGYLYGIMYFYSTVDILLASKLHVTNKVFYTVTTLSSFAKPNPQLLGKLCFIKNLDAIDQQFIHYCHVIFILIILVGIVIAAKCCKRIAFYVDHCIVQVVCLFLLFSYSSLMAISLILLRPLKFHDMDGLHTYLSPHLNYFADRHAVYATVGIFCGFLLTISFSFLFMEPCINKILGKCTPRCRRRPRMRRCWKRIKLYIKEGSCVVRTKQIIDQLQDCYKDQYRCFAAYYFICRLVIMLITSFAYDNYNNGTYYLQTACVIIASIHIWIQPYKTNTLNAIDTTILLNMLLIVNLNSFNFSTSTSVGITISLVIAPLLLFIAMRAKKALRHPLCLLFITKLKTMSKCLTEQIHQRNIFR